MHRSTRFTRIASLGAAAALALAIAAPVAAADAAKLTAVVAVDSTDTPEAGKAWVRVLHASPDAPAVDVKVNDADALTDVAFGTISDYLPVDAGTYNIKVCAAGTDTCVIDADLTFADGTRTTVAATNLLADIEAQVLVDGAAPGRRPGPGPRRPLLGRHARGRRPDPGRRHQGRDRPVLSGRHRLPRAAGGLV